MYKPSLTVDLGALVAVLQQEARDAEWMHDGRLASWEGTCAAIRGALADEGVRSSLVAAVNSLLEQHTDLLVNPERQLRLGKAVSGGGPGPGEPGESEEEG